MTAERSRTVQHIWRPRYVLGPSTPVRVAAVARLAGAYSLQRASVRGGLKASTLPAWASLGQAIRSSMMNSKGVLSLMTVMGACSCHGLRGLRRREAASASWIGGSSKRRLTNTRITVDTSRLFSPWNNAGLSRQDAPAGCYRRPGPASRLTSSARPR